MRQEGRAGGGGGGGGGWRGGVVVVVEEAGREGGCGGGRREGLVMVVGRGCDRLIVHAGKEHNHMHICSVNTSHTYTQAHVYAHTTTPFI